MKLNSLYPVIMTDKVRDVAEFYASMFNFSIAFDSDWYISLMRTENDRVFEIAVLNYQHDTVPKIYRKTASGFIINFEVADATEMFDRVIKNEKINIIQSLKDEEFGQRHFIIEDPAGVLIDVIENIPPSKEYLSMYQNSEA